MAYTSKYVIFTFEGSTFQVELADFGGIRGGKPYRYSIFVHARSEGVAAVIVKGMKGRYTQIFPHNPDLVDAEGGGWHIIQARRCGFSAQMTTSTASFHITIDYKGKRPAVVSVNKSGESLISVPLTDIEEQRFNIERLGSNFHVIQS
jgi:hypothetical protein